MLREQYQGFEKMGMRMGAIAQQPSFGKRSQSLQVTRWIAKAHVDAGALWWRGEALTSTGQGRLRWFHCESPLKVPWKCHLRNSPNFIPQGGVHYSERGHTLSQQGDHMGPGTNGWEQV